jgi:hypothetical protein
MSAPKHKIAIGLIVGLLVTSIWLVSKRVVPMDIALTGIAILWLSLLPGLIYIRRDDGSAGPFFPAVCLFYALFFAIPIFAIPLAWVDASSIVIFGSVALKHIELKPVLLATGGIALMIATFYVARRHLRARLSGFRLPVNADDVDYRFPLWCLAGAHFTYRLIPALSTVPSIGQILDPAIYVALGGLYLIWRSGHLWTVEKIILVAVVIPLELYVRLRFVFLSDLLLLFVFCAFLLWRTGQTRWLLVVLTAIPLLLSAYHVSHLYRHITEPGFARISATASALLQAFTTERPADQPSRLGATLASLTHRTAGLWVFNIVYDSSPDPIPYWRGETYRPLATSFIPRFLYPDKPREVTGEAFGKRYGFMPPDDTSNTSFNLPWITELLANFGPLGVIVGMTAIGVFLAMLDLLFNRRESSDLEFVIGLTLIFPLVYPESNFSVMTGSMLPLFAALYAGFVAWAFLYRAAFAKVR